AAAACLLAVVLPAAPAMAFRNRVPSPRTGAGMAYDAAQGQMVLFGGRTYAGRLFSDTWTWNGAGWTKRSVAHSPPPRSAMGMAYDAARQEIVMFGGWGKIGRRRLNDTWTWDGNDWTVHHPVHRPPPRGDMGMAYDAADAEVVMFGGLK